MIEAGAGGLIVAFMFIVIAAVSKNEKWQMAYGVVGLVFLFWTLGVFGYGTYVESLIPGLAILFGLFSVYTKGNAQLLSLLVTLVMVLQLPYV